MSRVFAREAPQFANPCAWIVAERVDHSLAGFDLATSPGTGMPRDPADAAVLALLAVDPAEQGSGLGRRLLEGITTALRDVGFELVTVPFVNFTSKPKQV